MSRELSLYEAMGGTYTEIDGVFYPDISIEESKPDGDFGITNAYIGKYGLLWISYMMTIPIRVVFFHIGNP